jgi:hypothetical protein
MFVMVALQASLAYNTVIGHDIQAKYQRLDIIPDRVKTFVDDNVYQRYSIDPPRIVLYPEFYRNGFKFFNGGHYQYAVSYDGTGKYTVYRKLRSEASGNKRNQWSRENPKPRYDLRFRTSPTVVPQTLH